VKNKVINNIHPLSFKTGLRRRAHWSLQFSDLNIVGKIYMEHPLIPYDQKLPSKLLMKNKNQCVIIAKFLFET
jgi:hypothetical protein